MKNKDTISLLGCGWLGFPLAVSLISKGFIVKGTSTSPEKLLKLEAAGIDPYLVQFSPSKPDPDLLDLLQTDTLIISIPPGRKNNNGTEAYRKMISQLSILLPDSNLSRLIFISSTSVYPDLNSVINESTQLSPSTVSGKLMAEAEMLLSTLPFKVIILRSAGMIGPERLPGKFFSGKTNIPGGGCPVNLIHLDDIIGSIHCLIENDEASGIYNVCASSHPTREEFYTLAAKVENLELPHFLPGKMSWKIVSCERLVNELKFKFKYPSLMNWLNAQLI